MWEPAGGQGPMVISRSCQAVGELSREVLVDQFLRRFLATATSGTQTAAIGQVRDMNGAVFHVLADIGIGDGFAQAYVHDGII
jgi:hypothetical protein